MTDPAEPEFFCAIIGMESRTKKRKQSMRISMIDEALGVALRVPQSRDLSRSARLLIEDC
jgi:hypothetical protein